MPTINQLIANPRKPLRVRITAPALESSPQKRGVCTRRSAYNLVCDGSEMAG